MSEIPGEFLEEIFEGLSELLNFHDYRKSWDKLDVSVDSDMRIQEYRQYQK